MNGEWVPAAPWAMLEAPTQPAPERADMKRDMDLVRQILLAAEAQPIGETLEGLDGVEQDVFSLHVIWMKEAGLVHAAVSEYMDGGAAAFVFRLTWSGCEFADAVRSDTLWKKAKTDVLKPGMSFTFDVLKEWLKTEITQGFPTARALG